MNGRALEVSNSLGGAALKRHHLDRADSAQTVTSGSAVEGPTDESVTTLVCAANLGWGDDDTGFAIVPCRSHPQQGNFFADLFAYDASVASPSVITLSFTTPAASSSSACQVQLSVKQSVGCRKFAAKILWREYMPMDCALDGTVLPPIKEFFLCVA